MSEAKHNILWKLNFIRKNNQTTSRATKAHRIIFTLLLWSFVVVRMVTVVANQPRASQSNQWVIKSNMVSSCLKNVFRAVEDSIVNLTLYEVWHWAFNHRAGNSIIVVNDFPIPSVSLAIVRVEPLSTY